jgi:flagellar biosynthetic protein FliR
MTLLDFSPGEYKVFILILTRVSIFLFMFPVFGSPVVPSITKIGLALLITFILYPVAGVKPDHFPNSSLAFGVLVVGEFVIGMVLAYTVDIFFGAVQLAGQIVGFQMGFSMINVIDPQSGTDLSIISQVAYLVVILIFIMLGGHHIVIQSLVESFRLVNMGDFYLHEKMSREMISMINGLFALGIKMAAPAMAALFFTNAAFGICAKFVDRKSVV